MATQDRPQITLITPPVLDLDIFPATLARVMDGVDIACLRLSLASKDPDDIGRAADAARLVAHARDVAIVIENHALFVERHGLDGIHLTDGSRAIRALRKELGADAIVGSFCGVSRHEGMSAGEAGADYIAFGPIGEAGLGLGTQAPRDLFEWWSEMIEVPVIAEGALTRDLVESFAPVTDFFALGPEIWGAEDPLASLKALLSPIL
jgi:thiamine-phosphate pyrophosphorylase